jgi:hypothetical protein
LPCLLYLNSTLWGSVSRYFEINIFNKSLETVCLLGNC